MSSGAPRHWAMFYRWQHRVECYGLDGIHPRRQYARPGRPVELAPETERLLVSVAVSAATWGAGRIAAYVGRRWGLRVAPSTVQRALRRAGLATRRQRLTILEHHALQTAGLLTDPAAALARAARPHASRRASRAGRSGLPGYFLASVSSPTRSQRTVPLTHAGITNPLPLAAPRDGQPIRRFETTRRVVKPGLRAFSGAIYFPRAVRLQKRSGPPWGA
jgi:transposase